MIVREFGEAKIEDFDVAATRDKDIPRLDIAVNDALGVRCVEPFGNLHRKIEEFVDFERFASDALPQRLALEELHRKKIPAAHLSNLVDGADIGMVQCGGSSRFAAKPLRRLRVVDQLVGEEFEGDAATELEILGFIDLTHTSAANLFQYPIVRDGSADQEQKAPPCSKMLGAMAADVNGAWVNRLEASESYPICLMNE